MDYRAYIERTICLAAWAAAIDIALLVIAHFMPSIRLLAAIVVGVTGVWCAGNILCMIAMIVRNEKAS